MALLQGDLGRSTWDTCAPCCRGHESALTQSTVLPHVQVSREVERQQPRLDRVLNLPEGSDYGQHLPAWVLVRTVESVPNQNC